MDQAFLVNAMTVLLSLPNLGIDEHALLSALKTAAVENRYWDAIERLSAVPEVAPLFDSIKTKGRNVGLEPVLVKLRKEQQ